MKPYTVIFIDKWGEICTEHVMTSNPMAAFSEVAQDYPRKDSANMVAAIEGHILEGETLFTPGTTLVSSVVITNNPEIYS